ncbi:hypothetical protein Poli38472_013005 [Pythium oligandrum]|uniref:Uncharacterized protein n=1 Tax=Pythium oligandrum TaxID=41045 RepID=A0A8K1CK17_PYTOL|nr:hypothetical protein Poli38472_013005 [Pythium oligandrum]|eukprot:TMW64383.1 hypothetical protein Poli38472_013005 [Pythium oligandrum]
MSGSGYRPQGAVPAPPSSSVASSNGMYRTSPSYYAPSVPGSLPSGSFQGGSHMHPTQYRPQYEEHNYNNGARRPVSSPSSSSNVSGAASPAARMGHGAPPRQQPRSRQQSNSYRMDQQRESGSYQQNPVSPIAVTTPAGRGSTSSATSFYSSTPSPANSTSKKKVSSGTANAATLEEGDFVWVSDPGAICIPAVLVRAGFHYDEANDREQPVIVLHTEEGEEREIRDDRSLVRLPRSHHPKNLPPLEVHDLSTLSLMATNGDIGRNEIFTTEQLENIVLYTLRARFRMEQVYTWIDRVLISVNPVVPLPIYTPDHMQAYNKSKEETPFAENENVNGAPPHVFAIAQNAIRSMQDAAEDQAVILLGGMGSGKSEAAKLIVQYLCEIGENPMRSDAESDPGVLHPIGQQILHAFTILEAFGNASTPQNRNSSRFAKMISVEFSKHGYVIGGGFTTHYFEKTRVIDRREQERNFHVFYQVLAGVQHDPSLRDALELNRPAGEWDLLKTADQGTVDSALDARDYRDLMSSFSALRIRKNQRMEIVRIIAALLHLGNVEFIPDPEAKDPKDSSASCVLKDPNQIVLAARLLEVEPVVLDNYFRTRQFFSKDGSKTVSSLKVVTVNQARRARDTFIRSMYESLFSFLVETMNGILGGIFDRYEKSNIVINSQGVHVLDIVGFESLDGVHNGFDQLCFNYWSEKVHNFYVQNTLATNLADLESDQFLGNRLTQNHAQNLTAESDGCLSLFENVPFGIFALLNDHSKVRTPNDEDLVSKILAGNEGLTSISRPNVASDVMSEYLTPSKEWRSLFVVHHYSGKVTYSGKGLSTKNTMTISATCGAIMHSSKNAVLHAVGAAQVAAASDKSGKRTTKGAGKLGSSMREVKASNGSETAATEVMSQADALLHALTHTGKNFLICIKPNQELEEGVFDSELVMKQVRETHVVDLIRASRSVYSTHLTFNHFFRRYKSICGHRGTLESLLRSLSAIGVLEDDNYVAGKSKVYLTSHQWRKLEKARFLYLNACATMIQRNMMRGASKKKWSKVLLLLRGLKMATKRRSAEEIIQIVGDCTSLLGKKCAADIRVLSDAKQAITRVDEELYIQSIIDDAKRIGHEVLIDYALNSASKYTPHLAVDELKLLKRRMKDSQGASARKSESSVAMNQKLRSAIMRNEPDTLMGVLATLEEASMESIERKLATMMIIRALEEKSVVESLTGAVSFIKGDEPADKVISILLPSITKAVEFGVEARFPDVGPLLLRYRDANEVPTENTNVLNTVDSSAPMDGVTVDSEALASALEKSLAEDNIVAAQKVLGRMKTLGVPATSLMSDAEKRIQDEIGNISVSNERKLVIKFLNIAKVSRDLELLNDAIDAAQEAGLAKWDFNLKNAERERDKILSAGGSSQPITPSGNGAPAAGLKSSARAQSASGSQDIALLYEVWSTSSVSLLENFVAGVPRNLRDLLQSKISRQKKVSAVETKIQQVLRNPGVNAIEDAFQSAIGIGYCAGTFGEMFSAYDRLTLEKKASPAVDSGLVAVVRFLTGRLDSCTELRPDALDLLAQEQTAFSNIDDIAEDERRDILSTAASLRRQLESCIAAATRLESALGVPAETLTLGKLEANLDAAKKAGVHKRLLQKVEEKMLLARSSTLTPGDRPSLSLSIPDDLPPLSAGLSRLVSDTTGWDGDDLTVDRDGIPSPKDKDALAFSYFENLRSSPSLSEKSHTKKYSWEGRALSQSLSELEDQSDCSLALSINRCVLGYMRDRIVFYREMLAQYVLQIGLVKASLVDEIYLQLMKQLTKNPKRDSSIRGWSLFAMCAASFPPSSSLEKYVMLFLKAQTVETSSFWRLVRNFAGYSLKKLENLLTNGPSGFIPSIEEIRGHEARPPFLATVELLDGTPLADDFPVTPELTADNLVEICAHFLGLDDRLGKYLGLCVVSEKIGGGGRSNSVATPAFSGGDNGTEEGGGANAAVTSYFHKFLSSSTFLNGDVYLGDIFEKELIRGRVIRLQLKIRLHPFLSLQIEDEMYDRMTYIQVQDEIVRGNLPVSDEDVVLRFTSIAIAVDCGEDLPQSIDEMLDMNVFDYIPVEWQATHTEEDWATLIMDHWETSLIAEDGMLPPVSELQLIYIEEASRHRLYGAVFFPCKLLNRSSAAKRELLTCLGIDLPSYFVLAVNCYGIHFVSRDGSLLVTVEYPEIMHWGGTYHQYKITLQRGEMLSSEDLVVTTRYSEELSSLLSDYKELTAILSEM